ncbi:ATP-binding protein [Streptomyces sp. NPDC050704]|uniref:ATP-binding protein n=1 Tax=Streptomyces sp. NPDC050704 TaxID=3157219 RepID=UPI00341FA136
MSLVVAELAANAVTHGAAPGRDALLRLVRQDGRVRVEVSDTRGERLPVAGATDVTAVAGRRLPIVGALAKEWGVLPRGGAPGKTVWVVVPTTVVPASGHSPHLSRPSPLPSRPSFAPPLSLPSLDPPSSSRVSWQDRETCVRGARARVRSRRESGRGGRAKRCCGSWDG